MVIVPVKFGFLAAKFVAPTYYCFLSHDLISALGIPPD